jgi:hypothetical protein
MFVRIQLIFNLFDSCEGLPVILPKTPAVVDENRQVIHQDSMVDSVLALNGTTWVACKSLRGGHITIFDSADLKQSNNQLKTTSYGFLKWALSFDAYLSLGWEQGNFKFLKWYSMCSLLHFTERKILACGDYKGGVWIYNLDGFKVSPENNTVLEPNSVITWPKLKDFHVENERKLKIGTYEILVSQVALNGDYLTAVTRTNLICVWKKSEHEKMETD